MSREILLLCRQEDMQVNITTNGTLLLKRLPILLKYPVHQINVSLHSADDNDCINMDTYYKDVFKACQELLDNTDTEISLRLWTTTNAQGLFGILPLNLICILTSSPLSSGLTRIMITMNPGDSAWA